MTMKKFNYSFVLLALVAFVFSCTDDSQDPLQQKNIKKGIILALRGTQLDNLYIKGIPGAEVFPKIMNGTEKFSFDAEFLAEKASLLASVDVYVIKKSGTGNTRILMSNIPASSFKTDGTYKGPWVTISYDIGTVLSKIGLPAVGDPIYLASGTGGNPLLSTYQPGINFEADLNLTDGTQVKADQIVAAGLFLSNQFYPAQLLTWTMTDYCAYVSGSWGGTWFGDEIGVGVFSPPGGDPLGNFVSLGTDKWRMDNFFGDGPGVYANIVLTPSTNPATQIVKYLNDPGLTYQLNVEGKISGTGTYNQCTQSMSLNTTYVVGGGTSKWIYNLHR